MPAALLEKTLLLFLFSLLLLIIVNFRLALISLISKSNSMQPCPGNTFFLTINYISIILVFVCL